MNVIILANHTPKIILLGFSEPKLVLIAIIVVGIN